MDSTNLKFEFINTLQLVRFTSRKDEKDDPEVSRRDYVKAAVGAAVGAVVGAAAGSQLFPRVEEKEVPVEVAKYLCPYCTEEFDTEEALGEHIKAVHPELVTKEVKPWLPEKWDKEADVVVVGFGGAGAAAAIEAHDAGAKVLILETAPAALGGSTGMCGGVIYGAGTSVQRVAGIMDSADEMYKYWMAVTGPGCDAELARLLADKSAENIEWLIKLGAEIPSVVYDEPDRPVPPAGGLYFSGAEPEYAHITPPKPRGHAVVGGGKAIFETLRKAVEARGIEVMLETRALKLIATPEKEVLGVKAESKGKITYIKARKAVVIATGEFTRNEEMLKRHCPRGLGTYPVDDPNALGDGHIMADDIGADLVNMHAGFLYVLGIGGLAGVYSIYVNKLGRRFVNESAGYPVRGAALDRQPDRVAFAIIDEAIRAKTGEEVQIEAPTIEELATKIGVDPTILRDTINTYNEYVDAGKDPEFGKPKEYLLPIKNPPFYAKPLMLAFFTTGGIRINTKAQAIDVSGKIIPRLYAAGLASGGLFGEIYPGSGSSMANCICTGRIAGRNAAAETPWE